MINIKECKKYLINLEKRHDRLEKTTKNLHNKNYYDIIRFNAIEIKTLDQVKKYVIPQSIYPIIKRQRTAHNQLSMGAVGCYLSHLELYKKLLSINDDYIFILEDDTYPSLTLQQLELKINPPPNDWDIILIGGIYKKKRPINENYVEIDSFILLHAYLIRKKCIEKIVNRALPMTQQIDWWLSDLAAAKEIKIYGLTNTNWKQNPSINDTNIQTPMVIIEKFTNNIQSFSNNIFNNMRYRYHYVFITCCFPHPLCF